MCCSSKAFHFQTLSLHHRLTHLLVCDTLTPCQSASFKTLKRSFLPARHLNVSEPAGGFYWSSRPWRTCRGDLPLYFWTPPPSNVNTADAYRLYLNLWVKETPKDSFTEKKTTQKTYSRLSRLPQRVQKSGVSVWLLLCERRQRSRETGSGLFCLQSAASELTAGMCLHVEREICATQSALHTYK